jgi:hypothetical protein
MHGFNCLHRTDPFTAREFVDLRRHEAALDGRCFQPRPRCPVVREPRMPGVHEQERVHRLAPPEILGRHRGEFFLRRSTLRESITGEIHQVERRAGRCLHPIDVREPRLAWRRACARDLLAHERVDQARLADIRAPDEGDLREAVARKVARACGAQNECGVNLHKSGRSGESGGSGP